ncbi:LytR/AlgR family response regulator transcription factor [Frigoriflavimonas asaccharolytica]|uniref:Two-component system LytT family response regulator n=1 Tax=Frigoriflavimonas asaccharolytica TaxID=2735899 RepID=A0A8J8G862_9FLAO|nr:LytTR family DNA-binding domain-containing protein [Frigoriflavimonas asaccharolytica]NRS91289.1 two-component system LytT family response regulator [Frigoriflavimonas asaccharolytica]
MKVLIVDDEEKARAVLKTLLQENCPEINQILQAEDLDSGVALIKSERPNLVFLDIEMPEKSGLQILEAFENEPIDFQIIFVTAYNEFAIEAFKLSAVDYLLKPIDISELKAAFQKALQQKEQQNITKNLEDLRASFQKISKQKLALEVPRGMIFVDYDDIVYFEADGMYTTVSLKSQRDKLICKPLKHFAEQIEGNPNFYKPHRSYIININCIKEFHKKDGGYIVMENDKEIAISRDKKEEFFMLIQQAF